MRTLQLIQQVAYIDTFASYCLFVLTIVISGLHNLNQNLQP